MEFFGFVVLVLGLFGISLLRKHLREAKQLKLRQIIHEERIKAMEHQLPLPDVDDAELVDQLREISGSQGSGGQRGLLTTVLWVRIVTLCIGLASLFGGIGTAVSLINIADSEFSDYWSFGLIPAFIGLGLLIFFGLSKSLLPANTAGTEE